MAIATDNTINRSKTTAEFFHSNQPQAFTEFNEIERSFDLESVNVTAPDATSIIYRISQFDETYQLSTSGMGHLCGLASEGAKIDVEFNKVLEHLRIRLIP